MAIHVGCGSWADAEYTGILYPTGLPASQRLREYARWFDHVEVNSSYYATPKAHVVEGWLEQTPPLFTFNLKLHRAVSQNPKKAAESGQLIELLVKACDPLIRAKRLGAFLLVLPPTFAPQTRVLSELDAVAAKLRPHRLAVELRHRGWVDQDQRAKTFAYFRKQELTLVGVDMPVIAGSTLMPRIDEVPFPGLAYLRLHGRNPRYLEAKTAEEGHTYAYSESELDEIAERVARLAEKAKEVHVIANNHAQDFAPRTALGLKHRLGLASDPLQEPQTEPPKRRKPPPKKSSP